MATKKNISPKKKITLTPEQRLEHWKQYPKDVCSGKIVAGKYIKLACERFLDWFDRDDIFFDLDRMDKIENFINHMKHFQGHFAGKPFKLLDFQRFVLAGIFGWYYTANPEKRVTETVIMFIARKNAKTALSAAILLSELCIQKEAGAEVFLAANTRDQARIALSFIKGYAKSLDPKGKHFKIMRDSVQFPKTNSFCKVISAQAGVNDGGNPSIFLIDEHHACQDPNDGMFQVLRSGQAMRKNPMAIIISSGGYLMDGFPFYERIKSAHQQLDGVAPLKDSVFYALFELDRDDDWTDETNYIKANPSLGSIVQPEFLEDRLADAKQNMAAQVDFKIKNLDIFVTAKNIWLEPQIVLDSFEKLDMEALKGEPCYGGIDLSSVSDLTAFAACWPPNPYRTYLPEKYLIKIFSWVPQAALETSNGVLYNQFIHQGLLKMTSGNSVDYQEILHDLTEFSQDYPISKLHYDEWNATSFIQSA